MPKIVVNGESREVAPGTTVDGLVQALEREGRPIDRRAIAVEVNREVVPRSTYGAHPLAERDVVEIVTIVGGG
jgi:thiamine biosynthesis protein ThiS